MSDADTTLLPADVDPFPELFDHPDELTTTEAALGRAFYQSVHDLNDHSNGVESIPEVRASLAPFVGAERAALSGRALAQARAEVVRAVMLRHGVPEVSIELVQGRPTSGDPWNALSPVAVLSHHIASNPTADNPTPGLWLVTHGRSDLAGPLCNGTAGVDLVYRIKCLGYANHSGTGGPWTVSGPLGSYTIPRDNGRAYLWGTEYEGGYTNDVWDKRYTNKRTGVSMTFREFMGRANAALVEAVWLINGRGREPSDGMDLSGYAGEHKTWAPGRKPDRKDYTTESGRAEIRRYNIVEDDVSAKDVWEHPIQVEQNEIKKPAGEMLAESHRRALDARDNARRAANQAERAGSKAAKALQQARANRDAIAAMADSLTDDAARSAVLTALGPPVEDTDDDTDTETLDAR